MSFYEHVDLHRHVAEVPLPCGQLGSQPSFPSKKPPKFPKNLANYGHMWPVNKEIILGVSKLINVYILCVYLVISIKSLCFTLFSVLFASCKWSHRNTLPICSRSRLRTQCGPTSSVKLTRVERTLAAVLWHKHSESQTFCGRCCPSIFEPRSACGLLFVGRTKR